MPLAGTKREQKHYRAIRKEYPKKGKEYAARVARNIVRANTSMGRKLKGTTEYGRTWGPPYAEPLSKKGTFYTGGVNHAWNTVGFGINKIATWQERLLDALKSKQYGEFLTRMPMQMATGSALGALTGSLSDQPLKGAGIGALGGLVSGFSVAAAPRLRGLLIKRLQQMKHAEATPILMRQRKDPFTEIHHKLNQVFKIRMPKFDIGAQLQKQTGNPLKQPRLHLSGKTPPLRV